MTKPKTTNMNKTVLTELIEWVKTDLTLDGYEHQVIIDKIRTLIPKEKEDGIDLILEGMKFFDNGIKKDSPTNRKVAETVFNNTYKQK